MQVVERNKKTSKLAS